MRYCSLCCKPVREMMHCGRRTITLRQKQEWIALLHLAELKDGKYLTARQLHAVAGLGSSMCEFGHVLKGLEKRKLVDTVHRWSTGMQYHRVPGALVKWAMGEEA